MTFLLRRFASLVTLAAVIAAIPAHAQSPAALGFDPARLGRLDAVVNDYIARQQLAGGIVYVARDGQVAHLKAYGHQDIEAARPCRPTPFFASPR